MPHPNMNATFSDLDHAQLVIWRLLFLSGFDNGYSHASAMFLRERVLMYEGWCQEPVQQLSLATMYKTAENVPPQLRAELQSAFNRGYDKATREQWAEAHTAISATEYK